MDVISNHGQTQIHNHVFGPNEGAGQKDRGAFCGAGEMKQPPSGPDASAACDSAATVAELRFELFTRVAVWTVKEGIGFLAPVCARV